ncbi:hypothetical protein [Streptomyces sp. TLI_146]|uniref:hypothetical protein n=1 Tax=Streptomyces sp. TLI_146 TaxID=1938858 RepID=UPI000C711CDB|nr:hypothetical protein [Streptomyces sp. TLI_146]PKV83160.1 hypothetical protein BX283_0654 [Streptomyces sp. TLI_146]
MTVTTVAPLLGRAGLGTLVADPVADGPGVGRHPDPGCRHLRARWSPAAVDTTQEVAAYQTESAPPREEARP